MDDDEKAVWACIFIVIWLRLKAISSSMRLVRHIHEHQRHVTKVRRILTALCHEQQHGGVRQRLRISSFWENEVPQFTDDDWIEHFRVS